MSTLSFTVHLGVVRSGADLDRTALDDRVFRHQLDGVV
jgi:hypothetical protein